MKKAFTLIELLVIVLIMGILAAIALPQYHVAVGKTHLANLQQIASIYERAAKVYHAETGEWPNDFDVLAVDVPGGNELKPKPGGMNSTCAFNEKMYCCINGYKKSQQSASIICATADENLAYKSLSYQTRQCMAKSGTWFEKVCKSVGRYSPSVTQLQTPTGYKSGYVTYTLSY